MSGWLEIREPGFHAVLANGALPGQDSDEALNQFHARILLNRIVRNADALGTIRRGAHRLGFAPWMKWASDEQLTDYLIAGVSSGRLLLEDLEDGEEEEAAAYRPNMREAHIFAFQKTAKHFNVFILLRETNRESMNHFNKGYAVPKPLDCKAKTADLTRVAGLVVDPRVTGYEVFKSTKQAEARECWGQFESQIKPQVATLEAQRKITYLVGGRYFVDLDPNSPYYGCVKITPTGLLTAGKYIHGDYDLYGIVPAADPAKNVRVKETRLDQDHTRSPEFFDVQHMLNRELGVAMVLHGAEETFKSKFSDDPIDIFHPDGTITHVQGKGELAGLYQSLFKGRKLFQEGGQVDIVRGAYVTPA